MNPPIPLKLKDRPLYKGLPVPMLVMFVDGQPDFRIVDLDAWDRIANNRLCSLCGHPLRKLMWFIGGPGCMEERLFFDLPVHEDCGLYAFKVCPHLALTTSNYNKKALPDTSKVIVDYRADVPPQRPERMGFAATNGYHIARSVEQGQPIVKANPWMRGSYWFADRKDAEAYEGNPLGT